MKKSRAFVRAASLICTTLSDSGTKTFNSTEVLNVGKSSRIMTET